MARSIGGQSGIFDNVSLWKAILLPILLCVSHVLISVTKLWDMILSLCMCKGQTGFATVLDSNTHYWITNNHDMILDGTGTWDRKDIISDKIFQQNVYWWCQVSHGITSECAMETTHNDDRHAAFMNALIRIAVRLWLVNGVETLEYGNGTSCKLRRKMGMRHGEKVRQYISKTS